MAKRAPGAGFRIREIRDETEPAFRAGFRFLARVFPPAELVPRRAWVQTLRERREGLWTDLSWHLFVAERGRRVVGVAAPDCQPATAIDSFRTPGPRTDFAGCQREGVLYAAASGLVLAGTYPKVVCIAPRPEVLVSDQPGATRPPAAGRR